MAGAEFCPYVGLRPFTAAERIYFFGRERDQRVIAANLFAAPLTVLYGPSAVGKSSVLQAGVVPQLSSERRTAVVYFATWQDETYLARLGAECRGAVAKEHGVALDVDDTLPLDDWLSRASEQFHGTLFLILDQFEEYLLYHSENGESSFDEELARVVNRQDVQANVLIGIREDGLAKLDRFKKRIPNLLGNTLRLRRLSPEAAREAITGPINVYNEQGRGTALPMKIEPVLIDSVVAQVGASRIQMTTGGTGTVKASEEGELIETALLQMVMTRLWNDARVMNGTRVMEKASLDSLGGARNVVKLHLYERLNELPAEGKAIAIDLFQELVTPSGAKIAHTTDDLVLFAKQPAERVIPVLEHLARARLLRRVDPPERYEIFHDALAPAILDWRAEYLQEFARKTAVLEAERLRKVESRRRNLRLAAAFGGLIVVAMAAFGVHYFREADRQRLAAEKSEARANQADYLQQAATQLKIAAEQSKREVELTLQQSQFEVQALKAERDNQPNRAAELRAKAKVYVPQIATAHQESSDANQRAMLQLEKAEIERKKADALPPVGGGPTTGAEPKTEEGPKPPPDTRPSTTTPAPTKLPQGDYKSIYRQAINASDRKRWSDAASLFRSAASLKADSGEIISMPGFGDDKKYLPYYNLGLALQNMNDCPAAIQAWDEAESAGAVQKSKGDYDALKRHRAECTSK